MLHPFNTNVVTNFIIRFYTKTLAETGSLNDYISLNSPYKSGTKVYLFLCSPW